MEVHGKNDSNLSPLKRALIALKELRAKLEAAEYAAKEPIAIVGMACRFPGRGQHLDAYWQVLLGGIDAVGDIPANRWDVNAYYDANAETPGKMYTKAGGFLDPVDQFDAAAPARPLSSSRRPRLNRAQCARGFSSDARR